MIEPDLSDEFQELLKWANDVKAIGVRANADAPDDAKTAREFGAGRNWALQDRAYVYGSRPFANSSANDFI